MKASLNWLREIIDFQEDANALSALLTKAEESATARGFDPSVLLTSRLAPDMFPLTRQVQIASDGVKGGVARLAGADIPKMEDTETTFAELKERMAKTDAFIAGFKPEQIDGSEGKDITLQLGPNAHTFKVLSPLPEAKYLRFMHKDQTLSR